MKLHFLSGLPRSGSTVLSSILSQNPAIYSEGVSGLCDLMWSMSQSVERNKLWNGNPRAADHIVETLPQLYYREVSQPIVIDKCRAWTLPLNVEMLRKYITPKPKIICSVRNIDDIVRSFLSLFARNGREDFFGSNFEEELIMAQTGLQSAISAADPETFLLVDYDDLIENTCGELLRVYSFLSLEPFEHDLTNIVNMCPENDAVYGLSGMHEVRSTIGRRNEKKR